MARETFAATMADGNLYARLLGQRFDRLPETVRAMHLVKGDLRAEGFARVTRGKGLAARLIGWAFGFPAEAHDVQVSIRMRSQGDVETWQRDFGGTRFSSRLSPRGALLIERFGPIRFAMELTPELNGLSMPFRRWWIGPVPMPQALLPRGLAREYEADGRFHFDVPIALPMIGLLVHYRGWLIPMPCGGTAAVSAPSSPRPAA